MSRDAVPVPVDRRASRQAEEVVCEAWVSDLEAPVAHLALELGVLDAQRAELVRRLEAARAQRDRGMGTVARLARHVVLSREFDALGARARAAAVPLSDREFYMLAARGQK
jgi:hypothetical protein